MELNKVANILKMLKLNGFIILPVKEGEEFLELLRSRGAIHLVQVYRLSKYMIVEINRIPCSRECDVKCRDTLTGRRINECFSECVDSCIIDRINLLISKFA